MDGSREKGTTAPESNPMHQYYRWRSYCAVYSNNPTHISVFSSTVTMSHKTNMCGLLVLSPCRDKDKLFNFKIATWIFMNQPLFFILNKGNIILLHWVYLSKYVFIGGGAICWSQIAYLKEKWCIIQQKRFLIDTSFTVKVHSLYIISKHNSFTAKATWTSCFKAFNWQNAGWLFFGKRNVFLNPHTADCNCSSTMHIKKKDKDFFFLHFSQQSN